MTTPLTAAPVVQGTSVPLDKGNVVLLGANGSGKSTFGAHLVATGNVRRISARRALQISDSLPVHQVAQATSEYRQSTKQSQSNRTLLVSDFQQLLTQLLAEETERARQILAQISAGEKLNFAVGDAASSLSTVKGLWEPLFPGRLLRFTDHAPTVANAAGGAYRQQEMSDGEVQALYLIAKVIVDAAHAAVIVVDEPEIHLHGALARRLWDAIEEACPSTRFFYITHDIPFATSRRGAQLGVIRSGGVPIFLPDSSGLPDDIVEQILGAISASKGRVPVYCEGTGASLDVALFEGLYRHTSAEVVPVGSCDAVVGCVRFTGAVAGEEVRAAGIVDRDERCPEELEWLAASSVHVLPVAEVEHLYATQAVQEIVARDLLKLPADEVARAVAATRAAIVAERTRLVHVHATRFAVEAVRWHSRFPKGTVSPGADLSEAERNIVAAMRETFAGDGASLLAAASDRLRVALGGGTDEILMCFSGKSSVEHAARPLGVSGPRYRALVIDCLMGKHGAHFEHGLRAALAHALPGNPVLVNPPA